MWLVPAFPSGQWRVHHWKRLSANCGRAAVRNGPAKREAARRARGFKTSDAIRAQLTEAGIIVEDSKDGVRWKSK